MARTLTTVKTRTASVKSYPDTINAVAELQQRQKNLGEEIKLLLAAGEDAGYGSKKHLRKIARESWAAEPDEIDAELDELNRMRIEWRDSLGELGEAMVEREEAARRRRVRPRKQMDHIEAAQEHLDGPALPLEEDLGEPLGTA